MVKFQLAWVLRSWYFIMLAHTVTRFQTQHDNGTTSLRKPFFSSGLCRAMTAFCCIEQSSELTPKVGTTCCVPLNSSTDLFKFLWHSPARSLKNSPLNDSAPFLHCHPHLPQIPNQICTELEMCAAQTALCLKGLLLGYLNRWNHHWCCVWHLCFSYYDKDSLIISVWERHTDMKTEWNINRDRLIISMLHQYLDERPKCSQNSH